MSRPRRNRTRKARRRERRDARRHGFRDLTAYRRWLADQQAERRAATRWQYHPDQEADDD